MLLYGDDGATRYSASLSSCSTGHAKQDVLPAKAEASGGAAMIQELVILSA